MESFSQRTKNTLVENEIKHKCCKRMYAIGLAFDANSSINLTDSIVGCDNCWGAFFTGLFISYGSLTDPIKQYHLEFSFYDNKNASEVLDKLMEFGFVFKKTVRKGKYIVYTKNSAIIEDYFAFIGANNTAFDLMNAKIEHEMKSSINRVVNCDTANVSKAVNASKKIIKIIDDLIDSGNFDKLPQEIKETAKLRKEYPQATLQELGNYHNPPITKSGVTHRLNKLTTHKIN